MSVRVAGQTAESTANPLALNGDDAVARGTLRQIANVPVLHLIGSPRCLAVISRITKLICAWRLHELTFNELSRLDDRELADIGINRGDIPRVAQEAAWTETRYPSVAPCSRYHCSARTRVREVGGPHKTNASKWRK